MMNLGAPGPAPMRREPETGEISDQPWGRGLASILGVVMLVALVNDIASHHWSAVGIEVAIIAVVVLLVLLVRRLRARRRRRAADMGSP